MAPGSAPRARARHTDYLDARLSALLRPARDAAQGPPDEAADAEPGPRGGAARPEPGWGTGRFERRHVAVVAVLLGVALAISGVLVLRARAERVPLAVAATPAAIPASSGAEASAPASSVSPTPKPKAATIQVHVAGRVKHPGVVRLREGSRVHDAVRAAGGLSRGAGTGRLNLARVVVDGEQVFVDGARSQVGGDASSGPTSGSAESSGGGGGRAKVNLNTATQAQLEELPGVGPVMAGKILAWRSQHGRFTRVEELQEIDGVGPKTYARLAAAVTV